MPEFPSVEWFEAVRESANNDSQFKSQGTINCRMGVRASDAVFAITFEGFECADVEAIPEHELRDLDFYIDLSAAEWKALLDNIAANGGSDSAHTLNTLDLTLPNAASSRKANCAARHSSSTTFRCRRSSTPPRK